ncbi:hypothetical protein ASE74_17030 [Pedobacter sp. Leaf216]|uniref:FecR family protein n=1 Tax=Pedobacter sp. Leaf216 TaxID=1735684 RepID=UPI0006FAABC2|nr:FecR family protein [Pedobacter sp. Leaf216]KQM76974.1 hypothetical protein ASE74_17030 [Pedobacter sp. Leaf216]
MEAQKFNEVLDRYIAGNATPEEEAWLESAYINLNNKHLPEYTEPFLESGSQQIWQGVYAATKPAKKLKLHILIYVAAALAVISLISIVVYKQNASTSNLASISPEKDIKAGKNKAVLTLANGTRINLEQIREGHLASQNGIEISKTADGQIIYQIPENKVETDETAYNTIETPAGGQYQLYLPDGTKVWLNASSSLTYSTSPDALRNVKLNGEAYFEVSKILEKGKRIPFVVESKNQKIEVLGTHFNVNAYADEAVTKTTLLEGSVKVNNGFMLKPGEQAIGNHENIKVLNVNAEDFIDWKNGDFILEHNDFRSVMRKIARWYDVEIIYSEDAPRKLNLGGWISRSKNISSILSVMEETGKVHFKIEGRRITVTK